MPDGMSLKGSAWANVVFTRRSARRFYASTIMALSFFLVVAQAQSGSSSAADAGDEGASASARSRARRVSTQEDSPPETTQKNDRISVLRAQIKDASDANERARLQRTLVDYLVALNRKSEAITELRAMMHAERVDAVGFYNIGNALARLGDTDAAIDAYHKAIDQRKGKYSHALNNLGVMLLRQERWDEALLALTAALRQENMRYGEASYNLGRLYRSRRQTKQAISEWTRALAVQPDHLDAALALARALADDGSPERGIAVIDAFVARHGPNKALIETRNEILSRKAGKEIKSPSPQPGTQVEAQTKTPGEPT
jgi:tetratricopeptide (TPR) repeat protein